jgi:hypothetical protein
VTSCGETRQHVRVPPRSDVQVHLNPCPPPRHAALVPE